MIILPGKVVGKGVMNMKKVIVLFMSVLIIGWIAFTSNQVLLNKGPNTQILNTIEQSESRQELTDLENESPNDKETFIWVTDQEIVFTQEKAEKIKSLAKEEYGYYIPDIVFIYIPPESLIEELKTKMEKAELYKKTFLNDYGLEHVDYINDYGPEHVDYISVHSKELFQNLEEELLIGSTFLIDDPNDFAHSNFGEFVPSQSASTYLGEYLGASNTKGAWQIEIPQLFYSTDEFVDILKASVSEDEG